MTEETGAAAPTTEQAASSAPAEIEKATQVETIPQDGVAPEKTETTENQETSDESSSEESPRRLSRSQRQQRKIARLATIVTEQSAELERLRVATQSAPQPPKEDDFNGDYFAYQRALTKWDTEQVLKETLSKVLPEQKKPDARELDKQELIEDLKERIQAAHDVLPDFKDSLVSLQKHIGDLSDAVLEEIGESEKGEFILYHLSKNPNIADSLNRMTARDAAREIARLEARLSLPQLKKQTKAPSPVSPLKGGAAPASDLSRLAKSDDASAYWAARRAQEKSGA